MSIRFSEQPEYMRAIPAFVDGDYDTARRNLQILIARVREAGEIGQVAYLLHVLGNVEAESGDSTQGHSLHLEAISLDGPHPFRNISYATGLVRSFKQPQLALAQLQTAEDLIQSGQWRPSEDDMSREWYEREIARLREEAAKIAA